MVCQLILYYFAHEKGDADFICGGPPCQGVSGFNRFRNRNAPLEDTKNKQLIVYMDIIDFLKPKYVLMENVVDILKFAGGYLGRYAVGRLVAMSVNWAMHFFLRMQYQIFLQYVYFSHKSIC